MDNGNILTTSNCTNTAYTISNYRILGADYKLNEITKMEIGKTEVFEITLVETEVREHNFSVIAKNKEDALEIIKKGGSMKNTKFISSEIVEKGF